MNSNQPIWPTLSRIFSSLALLAFLLLLLNLAIGLTGGDYNGVAVRLLAAQREVQAAKTSSASREEISAAQKHLVDLAAEVQPTVTRAHLHMWIGIAAALINILVNSITVTYFVGTTRWCREVAETYQLDMNYVRRSTALKRRTFPLALGAILVILVIVALGGASDPSSGVTHSPNWVLPHYTVALVGIGLIGWSFLNQARNLAANYEIIQQMVAEVQRIRQEHGLAVE